MSVVLWENLISRRRSRRNPAGAGLPLVCYTNTNDITSINWVIIPYNVCHEKCIGILIDEDGHMVLTGANLLIILQIKFKCLWVICNKLSETMSFR